MNNPKSNAGVALITALLVVALAATTAVALSQKVALDIRRAGNLIDSDQAWLYAQGAEAWSGAILARDRAETQIDSLLEPWAFQLPPITVPGGFIAGRIEDRQGRFNINNLIQGNGVDPLALARFQRLLTMLEIDPALAQAVIDWIDPNIEALPPDGAEDDYYLGLKRPYRTANQPMVNVSELRLVKGFEQKAYERITPFLTALPAGAEININTAPAPVLASLSPEIDLQLAGALIERRQEKSFESLSEFTGDPLIQGLQIDTAGLSVASQYFMLHTLAEIGLGRAHFSSLLFRPGQGGVHVIRRNQSLPGTG